MAAQKLPIAWRRRNAAREAELEELTASEERIKRGLIPRSVLEAVLLLPPGPRATRPKR